MSKVVKEVGSGVNDHRPRFLALREDQRVATIVVAQKERATCFGFHYVETLLHRQGRTREVVHLAGNTREGEELVVHLGAVMYSFCALCAMEWMEWTETSKTPNSDEHSATGTRRTEATGGQVMQLVEQHRIPHDDPRFAVLDAAAFASKNLWNAANYLVRQSFISGEGYLDNSAIYHLLKSSEAYQSLPAKVSNQVLIHLHTAWKAFFAAMKAWREHPELFTGRPKRPKYKHKTNGRNLLVYEKRKALSPSKP